MTATAESRLRMLATVVASRGQTWLLVRMAGWALVLPVLKRALPLPRLVRLMAPGEAKADRRPDREASVVRITRGLYRSKAVAGRDNCLERSLVAYRYLAREGADPRLVVGMRRDNSGLQGHVWLLVDGKAVHDAPEALRDFVPMVTFRADATEERPGG